MTPSTVGELLVSASSALASITDAELVKFGLEVDSSGTRGEGWSLTSIPSIPAQKFPQLRVYTIIGMALSLGCPCLAAGSCGNQTFL